MEEGKTVKNLKSLCLDKIVNAYNIDIKFCNLHEVNSTITAVQNLIPSLTVQNFYKDLEEKESDFGKLLWFFHSFVWNYETNKSLITDYKETLLTNWLRHNCDYLGEISFVGLTFTNLNLYFGLAYRYNGGANFKVHESSQKLINYQDELPKEIKDNHHEIVRLTVVKEWYIGFILRNFPVFFDLDKGKLFDFDKTLKLFGHPAFICKAKTYYSFMLQLLEKVAKNCNFYNYKHMPSSTENHLSIVKTVGYKYNKKCKRNFKRFCEALESLNSVESVELNLLEIPDKLKKPIVKSLNPNLINLKLMFFNPINFLLYVGKRFENLQTLEVAFVGQFFSSREYSKTFNNLNEKNLLIFQNLKCFTFHCNWSVRPRPFLLNTILTILNGCQKTLKKFKLEMYTYADVNEIVNFICSKNIPLTYIKFGYIDHLTDEHVLQIVKLECCDEVKIKIKYCGTVTRNGIAASLEYISQNNMRKQIEYY